MAELDMGKLNSRIGKSISTEETLKDVTPVNWAKEVLSGEKTVVVTDAKEEKKCVKLEILYS